MRRQLTRFSSSVPPVEARSVPREPVVWHLGLLHVLHLVVALRIDDLVSRFEVRSRVLPIAHAQADEQATDREREPCNCRNGDVCEGLSKGALVVIRLDRDVGSCRLCLPQGCQPRPCKVRLRIRRFLLEASRSWDQSPVGARLQRMCPGATRHDLERAFRAAAGLPRTMLSCAPVDIVTVGEAFEDLIFAGLPRLPRPGEEIRVPIFHATIGGGAVITAIAAARLGLHRRRPDGD